MTIQTFTSHQAAIMATPAGTRWSCSFGNQGEAGYTEYLHTPDDRRLVIKNGDWDALQPFVWTLEEHAQGYPAGSYRRTRASFTVNE